MWLSLKIIILAIGIAAAKNSSKLMTCGIRLNSTERILNGNEVIPFSYPWQVMLYGSDRIFCGGSLISTRYVLTAAHCIDGMFRMLKTDHFWLYLGIHDIKSPQIKMKIYKDNVTLHEKYNSSSFLTDETAPAVFQYDIGLIDLPTRVDISGKKTRAICLPPLPGKGMPAVGSEATVIGWGRTEKMKPHFEGLMAAETKIVSKMDAISSTNEMIDKLTDEQFMGYKETIIHGCGVYEPNKTCRITEDTSKDDLKKMIGVAMDLMPNEGTVYAYDGGKTSACVGDSGGSLNLMMDGQYYLAGIASSTLMFCFIGVPEPAYFTNTSYFLDWIKDNMKPDE